MSTSEQYCASISFDYVSLYIRVAEACGVDSDLLLSRSRIDPMGDDDSISILQLESLVFEAVRSAGIEGLGLMVAGEMRMGDHGHLSYAAMSSSTVFEAIRKTCQFHRIRNQVVSLDFNHERGRGAVVVGSPVDNAAFHQFLVEVTLCSCYLSVQSLLKELHCGFEFEFTYSPPSSISEYYKVFGKNIRFNMPQDRILVPDDILFQPVVSADPLLASMSEQRCKALLYATGNYDCHIDEKVKAILLSKPGFFPSQERVASELCMSVRTLRRRLSSIGTSYREIREAIRFDLAATYLGETEMKVEEIAYKLGFNEHTHFTRAFKKWSGKSPVQYRCDRYNSEAE